MSLTLYICYFKWEILKLNLSLFVTVCLYQGVSALVLFKHLKKWEGQVTLHLLPESAQKYLMRSNALNQCFLPSECNSPKQLSPWEATKNRFPYFVPTVNALLKVYTLSNFSWCHLSGWSCGDPELDNCTDWQLPRAAWAQTFPPHPPLWIHASLTAHTELFCFENMPNTTPASSIQPSTGTWYYMPFGW